jgi:glycosyltransferase involved in cell wall biosynthesis
MLSTGQTRRRVVVVQPYVPGYRTAFFDHLQARLDTANVALEVLYGQAPSQQAARRDASSCACAVQVPSLRLPVPGGRTLLWRQVFHRAASADLVVLEQALRNLEAYPLLLPRLIGRASRPSPPVAFWGHGRTYTKKTSRLQAVAKDMVTRQAAWFFAYTEGGAAYIASRGFPRDRITVLRNSVDTTELTLARDRADIQGTPEHAEAAALRKRYRLEPGRTGLYVGGLDAPKRIPLLLECARRLATSLPGFRLLVAGDGIDRALVEAAASAPDSPVVALGHSAGRHVALLGAVSDVMLMPGRVGLCAVDSFALRTPIVTTDWPWHAPEVEYLENGRNAVITRDDPEDYAAGVQKVLNDHSRLKALREACRRDATEYTAEGMAERFCNGLLHMLERNA